MTAIKIQRVSLLAILVSFIKSIFRRIGSVVQAIQEHDAPDSLRTHNSSINKSPVRKGGWIVRHSYWVKQKRKGRKKKRTSYVYAAIMEDYGSIVPRRQRKELSRQGLIPFTPYYN
jgi:hypothetical protein